MDIFTDEAGPYGGRSINYNIEIDTQLFFDYIKSSIYKTDNYFGFCASIEGLNETRICHMDINEVQKISEPNADIDTYNPETFITECFTCIIRDNVKGLHLPKIYEKYINLFDNEIYMVDLIPLEDEVISKLSDNYELIEVLLKPVNEWPKTISLYELNKACETFKLI